MTEEKRPNYITLIVGNRNTGKTTYMKGNEKLKLEGLIDIYLDRDPKQKILIVDLFDNPVWRSVPIITLEKLSRWKSGVYRFYQKDKSVLIDMINHYCFNTVIFFEDATKYITSFPDNLSSLLIDSKQKNNDVYFAFHFLMAIHPDIVRVSDYMELFKTNETFDNYYRKKYKNPDIEKAFKQVEAHNNLHYHKTIQLT